MRLRHVVALAMTSWLAAPGSAAWGTAASHSQDPGPVGANTLDWQPFELAARSGRRVEGAEISHLRVPENHRDPGGGRTLELAVVRLRSTVKRAGAPIVCLLDGPDESGIDQLGGRRLPLLEALREFGDVVVVDPRGAGSSRPSIDADAASSAPAGVAPDVDTLHQRWLEHVLAAAARARDAGADLGQYHVEAHAEDLEHLRRALGVTQLRLLTMGYGTHVALTFLRQYPKAAERAVLAAAQGPDHILTRPAAMDDVLDQATALVAADPVGAQRCPDLRGLLAKTLARLERAPVSSNTVDPRTGATVEIAIGVTDLQLLVSALIARRDSIGHLPRFLLPLARGDAEAITPFVLRLRGYAPSLLEVITLSASGSSEARRAQIAAERDASLLGSAGNLPLAAMREAMALPELPATSRAAVQASLPTLFLSGSLDPRAPASQVEDVRRWFVRSEHIVVEGAGHDESLLVGSPRIQMAIEAFLRGEDATTTRITLPPPAVHLPPSAATTAPRILVQHARVLDAAGTGWLDGHSVLVDGDRIVAIDHADALAAAPGDRTIDAEQRYLIPGLWDLHVHLSKLRRPALPLLVLHGVTAVRDLGGELAEVRAWQQAIRGGQLAGPRIWTAGPYLEAPQNIARMLRENVVEPVERARIGVRDPEHARAVVRDLAAQGVDGLKVRTVANHETYLALAQAAAAAGLPLWGHAQELGPDLVLRAGQRSIEHGFLPPLAAHPASERRARCRELADRGTALVPTMTAWWHSILVPRDEIEAVLRAATPGRNGMRPYVAAFTLADWREQLVERTDGALRLYRSLLTHYRSDLKDMRDAGVPILPGSDCGVLLIQPGASLHDELGLFVTELGMAPAEALAAATRGASALLGVDAEFGILRPGARADLVLLEADPLADIGHVKAVHGVMAAGRWYGQQARAALLTAIRGMPELIENDWPRPDRGG
ncbi:MAG: alpha/beta fold hydrolase [Planctomycetota bacterium]